MEVVKALGEFIYELTKFTLGVILFVEVFGYLLILPVEYLIGLWR